MSRLKTIGKSHTSKYPDPITFSSGDQLILGRTDEEYPGWIRATTPTGNEGWAPASYLEHQSSDVGIALRDYTARELNTRIGELVTLRSELNGWGWVENAEGDCGWIPLSTILDA